jgi:uncharacterized protein YkwD
VAALAGGVLILTGCGGDTASLSTASGSTSSGSTSSGSTASSDSGRGRDGLVEALPGGGAASSTISTGADGAGDRFSSATGAGGATPGTTPTPLTTHAGPTSSPSITAGAPRPAAQALGPGSTPTAQTATNPASRPVTAKTAGAPSARTTARSAASARAALVGAGATPTPGVLEFPPGTESAPEADVVRLVNTQRVSSGCRPLAVNATLVMVARAHSLEMSTVQDGVKHNSLDGSTPFQRMRAAGYSYAMAAENVAGGQPSAAAVVDAWMDSPGHRSNILNCKLTEIGVGMFYRAGSQYGTYWTQEFGTPM